jgi:hypothetical protein
LSEPFPTVVTARVSAFNFRTFFFFKVLWLHELGLNCM